MVIPPKEITALVTLLFCVGYAHTESTENDAPNFFTLPDKNNFTWDMARDACESAGGILPEIRSQEDNQLLRDYLRTTGSPSTWLGATDRQQEGEWRWASSGDLVTFTAWPRDQPDDWQAVGGEDCLTFHARWRLPWNDGTCGTYSRYDHPSSTGRVVCQGTEELANVAVNKTAEQSSTYGDWAAAKAVDGNAVDNTHGGSCSHTMRRDRNWLKVDLNATYTVESVKITNRRDCCDERLKDLTVWVGQEGSGQYTACVTVGGVPKGATVEFNCSQPVRGRYVRVDMRNGPLAICELQVMAKASSEEAPLGCPGLREKFGPVVACDDDGDDGDYSLLQCGGDHCFCGHNFEPLTADKNGKPWAWGKHENVTHRQRRDVMMAAVDFCRCGIAQRTLDASREDCAQKAGFTAQLLD